jgi:hypothetical protein
MFWLIESTLRHQGLLLLLVPIILLGFHYHQRMSVPQRAVLLGVLLGIILLWSIHLTRIMDTNIAQPPEWDFLGFWLNGKVAAQGLNFYEPGHAQQLAKPFHPSTEFTHEILDVGFWYPPPTIFLFLPLGWFDIRTAYLLWYVAHSIILILDIFWLWKIFLNKSSWLGLALTAALILMLFGTQSTIIYGQTNFLALLMLLLFWRDRTFPRSGIWLALGIFTKPFLALLLGYLLLRQHWRILGNTVFILAALSLLTITVFSPVTFFSYFTPNHYGSLPMWVYTEGSNQSLLAVILRYTHYDFSHISPLTQPIFVVSSLLLTIITGWLVYQLDKNHEDWALVLTLLLTLLLYPVSQMFYSLLLIVPMLLLWMHRQELVLGTWSVVGFITFEYAILSREDGNYVFIATMLTWVICAAIATWAIILRSTDQAVRQTLP